MVFTRRPHLPIRKPEDVIPYLGAEHHYVNGRSAKLIAEAWFSAAGDLPTMVRWTLDQVPRFTRVELVDSFLERCIGLGIVLDHRKLMFLQCLDSEMNWRLWPSRVKKMRALARLCPNG